jgi:hypothetical protein
MTGQQSDPAREHESRENHGPKTPVASQILALTFLRPIASGWDTFLPLDRIPFRMVADYRSNTGRDRLFCGILKSHLVSAEDRRQIDQQCIAYGRNSLRFNSSRVAEDFGCLV